MKVIKYILVGLFWNCIDKVQGNFLLESMKCLNLNLSYGIIMTAVVTG
jgi:hypothetical protein